MQDIIVHENTGVEVEVLCWWAACDYYRGTLKHKQMVRNWSNAELRNWVKLAAELHGATGDEPEARALFGYEGFAVGGTFVGCGPEGYMWQVSGEAAREGWAAVPNATKATRIDVQYTATLVRPEEYLALHELYARPARHKGKGRQAKGVCIVTVSAGHTLQIGSRGGDKFGRLYDKGAQSGEAELGKVWRWEVEYGGDVAIALGSHRAAYLSEPMACMQLVGAQFDKWGCWFPDVTAQGAPIPPVRSAEPFNAARRLSWLARQASRTVQRLESNELTRGLAAVALGIDTPENWLNNDLREE